MTKLLSIDAVKGRTDFAIITIREDEYEAVLERFNTSRQPVSGRQIYEFCRLTSRNETALGIAIVRSVSQGPNAAQSVARDVIEDLDPGWLLLVGIAGASPANEYSLGDVCLASRLNDFSVSAAIEGHRLEFQQTGGPMHREVERLLAWLPAMRDGLGGWNSEGSIGRRKPEVNVPKSVNSKSLYGPRSVRRSTLDSLLRHFPAEGPVRPPRFHIGPGATAGVLVKDTGLLKQWMESARHLTHVEMEAGGVYDAARHGGEKEYPLLCIRAISDVIGFKRSPEWTDFACHSAAAFVHALISHAPFSTKSQQRQFPADVPLASTSANSLREYLRNVLPEKFYLTKIIKDEYLPPEEFKLAGVPPHRETVVKLLEMAERFRTWISPPDEGGYHKVAALRSAGLVYTLLVGPAAEPDNWWPLHQHAFATLKRLIPPPRELSQVPTELEERLYRRARRTIKYDPLHEPEPLGADEVQSLLQLMDEFEPYLTESPQDASGS